MASGIWHCIGIDDVGSRTTSTGGGSMALSIAGASAASGGSSFNLQLRGHSADWLPGSVVEIRNDNLPSRCLRILHGKEWGSPAASASTAPLPRHR